MADVVTSPKMKIKNINGTSTNTCSCGSWLEHWKKFSGQSIPTYCSEKSCTKKDLVGAHVQKSGAYDSNWYIVPLCNSHNLSGGELEILDSITLVSANKAETCDKPKATAYRLFGP